MPNARPFWYPLLAQGANKPIVVSQRGQLGAFVSPHHRDGLEHVYAK